MAITLDQLTKIILVEAPQTEVTIQELINTIRDWEDELENMNCPSVARASGKESLGGGIAVGITLELLNGWQLKFEDRPGPDYIQCTISEGNLVGGIAGNPIKESAYTQVKLILSAAGTVAELGAVAQQTSLQNLINTIGAPTSPTIAACLDVIEAKTSQLPSDPAAQSLVETHVTTEVDDLITRSKGLDEIHDSVAERAMEVTLEGIKGPGWIDETLKRLKELIERIETAVPKASFKV